MISVRPILDEAFGSHESPNFDVHHSCVQPDAIASTGMRPGNGATQQCTSDTTASRSRTHIQYGNSNITSRDVDQAQANANEVSFGYSKCAQQKPRSIL